MKEKEGKVINKLKVGPSLAILLVCFLVLADKLPWWAILIMLLCTINWYELFRRWKVKGKTHHV